MKEGREVRHGHVHLPGYPQRFAAGEPLRTAFTAVVMERAGQPKVEIVLAFFLGQITTHDVPKHLIHYCDWHFLVNNDN